MLYFFFILEHNHYKLFELKLIIFSLSTCFNLCTPKKLLADWNLGNTKFDFASGFLNQRLKKRKMDRFVQPYDKECMKMALLKHEQTFKEQVYELHRLYQIQKMLMKNLQSSKHNYQNNNMIDLEQAATTKEYDHGTKTLDADQEIEEDECEIELTLAPTSFNRRRRSATSKPESSDSIPSFSSSSTGSSNIKKVERVTRDNSSFLSGNRRNNSSSDMSLKQPQWMCQVLSLNMT